MDVWKLTNKYKDQEEKLDFLIQRIDELQSCINNFIKERNEAIRDKEIKSSGVRAKGSTTAKS